MFSTLENTTIDWSAEPYLLREAINNNIKAMKSNAEGRYSSEQVISKFIELLMSIKHHCDDNNIDPGLLGDNAFVVEKSSLFGTKKRIGVSMIDSAKKLQGWSPLAVKDFYTNLKKQLLLKELFSYQKPQQFIDNYDKLFNSIAGEANYLLLVMLGEFFVLVGDWLKPRMNKLKLSLIVGALLKFLEKIGINVAMWSISQNLMNLGRSIRALAKAYYQQKMQCHDIKIFEKPSDSKINRGGLFSDVKRQVGSDEALQNTSSDQKTFDDALLFHLNQHQWQSVVRKEVPSDISNHQEVHQQLQQAADVIAAASQAPQADVDSQHNIDLDSKCDDMIHQSFNSHEIHQAYRLKKTFNEVFSGYWHKILLFFSPTYKRAYNALKTHLTAAELTPTTFPSTPTLFYKKGGNSYFFDRKFNNLVRESNVASDSLGHHAEDLKYTSTEYGEVRPEFSAWLSKTKW